MILSMSGQAWLFLSTVLVGACIGMFYDVFRIFRKTAPRLVSGKVLVQLEDLLFWVTATAGVFYFMLNRNFGEIRLFSVAGVGIGLVLYFTTVSRLIVFVFVKIIEYVKKVFAAAFKIITTPFRIVFKFISPYIKAILQKVRSGLYRVFRYGKIRIRKSLRNWFILRKKV